MMGAILEIIGWLIFLGVMLALIIITGNLQDRSALWLIIPWALPALFGSIMIIAFGQIVQHLKVIKDNSIRQTELMADLVRSRQKVEPMFGRDDL